MSTQRPPDEPSDQIKRDIEDILSRMGEDGDAKEPLRVAAPRQRRIVRPRRRGIQPGVLMAAGALLLILAVVLPPVRFAFALGGMLLLGAGYWNSWKARRPRPGGVAPARRGESDVRYWRGQRIDYEPPADRRQNVVEFRETLLSRLRRWWRDR